MARGAALSFQAKVLFALSVTPVIWGITWGINKYVFTQQATTQATSHQVESLSEQITVISSNQNAIYTRLRLLDSIKDVQASQRSDLLQLNRTVILMAKSANLRTDTLIRIIEQLSPLFSQKKTTNQYPPSYCQQPASEAIQ